MTLEQCKCLKEMGFPQGIQGVSYVEDEIDYYDNPTAEEALEWVKSKLITSVLLVNDDIT
jgi:hypothetical protein